MKLFLCDWGGVIEYSFQWTKNWSDTAETLGAGEPGRLQRLYYSENDAVEKQEEADARKFLQQIFAREGYSFSVENFARAHHFSQAGNLYRKDTAQFVRDLAYEYPVGIFSDVSFLDVDRENRDLGIGQIPYAFVFQSMKEGFSKSDGMDAFLNADTVAKQHGYTDIFFVDDTPKNLEKAADAGWKTLRFTDRDDLGRLKEACRKFFAG